MSGIVNIAGKVAGAFSPKKEEPSPGPVQVQIVEGRQKTKKEQVADWMNGGEEPEHIRRVKERTANTQKISIGGQEVNIENFSLQAQQKILGEMKSMPESEKVQRIREIRAERKKPKISTFQKVAKATRNVMIFMGTGSGKRRQRVGRYIPERRKPFHPDEAYRKTPNFDLGFGGGSSGKSKKKNNFNIDFGEWKL